MNARINSFVGDKNNTVTTLCLGFSDNPRRDVNLSPTRCAMLLSIIDNAEFRALLSKVANMGDKPAPEDKPAPVVDKPAPKVDKPAPEWMKPAPVVNKPKATLPPEPVRISPTTEWTVETAKAECQRLGLKGYGMSSLATLVDKIAKATGQAMPTPKPAPVQAPVQAPVVNKPAPVASKPARTLVGDFVNTLPDGREVYTAVYSDGSTHVEITGQARKVA